MEALIIIKKRLKSRTLFLQLKNILNYLKSSHIKNTQS